MIPVKTANKFKITPVYRVPCVCSNKVSGEYIERTLKSKWRNDRCANGYKDILFKSKWNKESGFKIMWSLIGITALSRYRIVRNIAKPVASPAGGLPSGTKNVLMAIVVFPSVPSYLRNENSADDLQICFLFSKSFKVNNSRFVRVNILTFRSGPKETARLQFVPSG